MIALLLVLIISSNDLPTRKSFGSFLFATVFCFKKETSCERLPFVQIRACSRFTKSCLYCQVCPELKSYPLKTGPLSVKLIIPQARCPGQITIDQTGLLVVSYINLSQRQRLGNLNNVAEVNRNHFRLIS